MKNCGERSTYVDLNDDVERLMAEVRQRPRADLQEQDCGGAAKPNLLDGMAGIVQSSWPKQKSGLLGSLILLTLFFFWMGGAAWQIIKTVVRVFAPSR